MELGYLSELKHNDTETESAENVEEEPSIGKSLSDAITAYRKIKEGKKELTDKELIVLDKQCKVIEQREIIELDSVHEPQEIEISGKMFRLGYR